MTKAMASTTAKTTPQTNDLIGLMGKNNRAARGTLFVEIFIFEVLTTTRARGNKSFILCLYMETIRDKHAKVRRTFLNSLMNF